MGRRGAILRQLSILRIGFLGRKGSRATLTLGYKWFPLHMCSMKILHTQYWPCSGSDQLCPLAFGPAHHWDEYFLVFSPAPLARRGVTYCLACTWALGMATLLVWGSESSRSAPYWVSWSECAARLVLQMSRLVDWDNYLHTASANSVCKHPWAGCCKPLFPSL